MARLTYGQARDLADFLEKQRDEKGALHKLAKRMDVDFEEEPDRFPKKIGYKTISRLSDLNAEGLVDLSSDSALVLHRYLEQHRFFTRDTTVNILRGAREFFKTNNMKFGPRDLNKLLGSYVMFRRFWIEPDPKTFMFSRVKIYSDDSRSIYKFRESQYWGEFDGLREINTGYLFPSGRAILAICNSVHRQNVKFFSISKLEPSHPCYKADVRMFSGTAIASSAAIPHVGYGFCCLRQSIYEERFGSLKGISGKISFSEMEEDMPDVLQKIIHNENYRFTKFVPIAPKGEDFC